MYSTLCPRDRCSVSHLDLRGVTKVHHIGGDAHVFVMDRGASVDTALFTAGSPSCTVSVPVTGATFHANGIAVADAVASIASTVVKSARTGGACLPVADCMGTGPGGVDSRAWAPVLPNNSSAAITRIASSDRSDPTSYRVVVESFCPGGFVLPEKTDDAVRIRVEDLVNGYTSVHAAGIAARRNAERMAFVLASSADLYIPQRDGGDRIGRFHESVRTVKTSEPSMIVMSNCVVAPTSGPNATKVLYYSKCAVPIRSVRDKIVVVGNDPTAIASVCVSPYQRDGMHAIPLTEIRAAIDVHTKASRLATAHECHFTNDRMDYEVMDTRANANATIDRIDGDAVDIHIPCIVKST